MDICRCNLVDINGKIYDYRAQVFSLGLTDLIWKSKIRVVSKESVEMLHSQKKVQDVYQAAEKHLTEMADYFAKYPAQLLGRTNPSIDSARKINEILEEKVSTSTSEQEFISTLELSIALSNKKEYVIQ